MATIPEPEAILESVAEEFTASLRAGEMPSVASYVKKYASRYPDLAEDLEDMLSSVALMEQLSQCESNFREQANAGSSVDIERLGDFDIFREIGRGGMGVVYEAVDRALQRRVALKVLNDTALTTQKHIDRFRRESRLAARLHHTNIVSVFGVGEDNRRHYYAMQYIEGVSVQDILDGLRRLPNSLSIDSDVATREVSALSAINVAAALRAGRFAEARNAQSEFRNYLTDASMPSSVVGAARVGSSSTRASAIEQTIQLSDASGSAVIPKETDFEVADSSRGVEFAPVEGRFGGAYWRSVARIGVQVADAIHYAHVNGILHRDIKPANLLFDCDGTVWVADFGLAKLSETDDLTKTGDVVGTLKYMAPEQLAGKADARTDIYALGLTLYELLTLQPVCDGENYKDLFAQKQSANHLAPRRVDPTIPRDLETIVQKALENEPEKRYASASDLAEDLNRFLDDRPILARRVSVPERVWRWCRRNKAVATLSAVVAGLFLMLPVVLGWAYMRETQQKEQMETTMNVVLDGFDELFGSYLENDRALSVALADSSGDGSQFAPAMLSKDTAAVMEKMVAVYDRLAETNDATANKGLAVESAKARRRVGDLYQRLGQFAKASESYDAAAERYRELSQGNPSFLVDIARTLLAKGAIHEQKQDIEAARADYSLALETLIDSPVDSASRYEQARAHYLLGKRPQVEGIGPGKSLGPPRGRPPGRGGPDGQFGDGPFGDGPFGDGPFGDGPFGDGPFGDGPFGDGPFGDGPFGDGPSSVDDHAQHLESAMVLLSDLLSGDADNAEHRFLMALCLREQEREGRVSSQERSIDLLSKLVEQFPKSPRFRFELSESYRFLGEKNQAMNSQERIANLLRARDYGEELVNEQRDVAPYRINLAHTYAFLGVEYGGIGDLRQAEAFTRLAIATHQSVVNDFPGLAPLSNRLSRMDVQRLGRWLLRLQRYEELIELLQPLGDQLSKELREQADSDSRSTLLICRELLLPAYEAIGDDVGYFVALNWIDEQRDVPPMRGGPGPGGPGPGGPGPGGPGPGGPGVAGGPPGGPFPPGAGLPRLDRETADPVEMVLSYDVNGDGAITRKELPQRMALEWFSRFDADENNSVDRDELSRLR